jgi:hypothetical protein
MDEAPIEKVDARNQKQMEKGNSPFILGLGQQAMRGLLPTPKAMEAPSASWENRKPNSKFKPGVTLTDLKVWGMLPTPSARDWKDTIGNGKDAPSIGVTRGYSLGQKLNSMLPTPTAMDSTNATATMKSTQVKEGSMHSMTLTRLLCTPTAQCGRGNTSDKRGKGNLTDQIAEMELTTSKTSQLNPRFVAEMMGFPVNWTELPFQSGEQNQSKDMEMP